MRALEPDRTGFIERDGVRIYFDVFGDGQHVGPAVLLLPTWSIIHSRFWKAQIPYLARYTRVITFDGRGNGRSDRPAEAEAYADDEFVADALSVMDATDIERAVLVSLSRGAHWAALLAAIYPERVAGTVFIGSGIPLAPAHPERAVYSFSEPLTTTDGWAKFNRHYWLKDYRGFLEFFFSQSFPEPHSTKQIEDCVGWGLETTPETLIATMETPEVIGNQESAEQLVGRIRCPVLVIHGDEDAVTPHARGVRLAELTGGRLVTIEGGGHIPLARDPVKVNLLLKSFLDEVRATDSTGLTDRMEVTEDPTPVEIAGALMPPGGGMIWTRGHRRRRRALFISSPIGLGHALRDTAIAAELRALRPDLEIDWLAQHPVTRVLEARGERIHPASALLASESLHNEKGSAEHDLHCFQALRRMDEIMVANYMVFHDAVNATDYDLWIGDEAWELDYFLHENPEEKRAAYVWLTDFVGYLPMPENGEREVFLTTDYNAEMIEHIERFPRIRDRAIFVGNPADIVPDNFGFALPAIRPWTERHFDFSGYISGFDPRDFTDRTALRHECGYQPDELVCLVVVGEFGVGRQLLRRVIAAFPDAQRRVPGLRMIVVTGPRIDPAELGEFGADGLEIRPYAFELYRHLAACDLAVVQADLSICMELTANCRPFLYFPLRRDFEQNYHVRYRLERYGAGRCMDVDTATPEIIAAAIAEEISRTVDYRSVESDGAAKAAARIAELL